MDFLQSLNSHSDNKPKPNGSSWWEDWLSPWTFLKEKVQHLFSVITDFFSKKPKKWSDLFASSSLNSSQKVQHLFFSDNGLFSKSQKSENRKFWTFFIKAFASPKTGVQYHSETNYVKTTTKWSKHIQFWTERFSVKPRHMDLKSQ